ncbi:uncharacterized protein LOC133725013 isoform X2 [Rosa rugosa]|uniref:uncharacterized protein LOC133725013 isoform X2 n=1 Tax=Rosa rugosa TaxID=74645 RepID=UPI002B4087B6|nr:uncharacterized protein LOC133725013 isoform X2 [Rosa rugosa]
MGWHQNHEKYLALPLYLDEIFHLVVAVLLSVTFVLIFREVLDLVLGHGDDLFRLAQSKALVSIHDLEAGKGGELTHDNDYSGALNLTEKTAKEAMTPIESRLCLDVDSKLDWFEHCGAVPLESCTSLFMSCQQCFKEAHWETGKSLPLKCTPIRFGSWMGGGRDGNPNVTAKVTKDVSLLSRWMTIDLYIREVDSLKFELSMNWCSNSLSKLAQEILEHKSAYEDNQSWDHQCYNRNQNAMLVILTIPELKCWSF